MTTQPRVTKVPGGHSVRLRFGADKRGTFRMPLEREAAAQARANKLAELADLLSRAGRHVEAPVLLRKAAAQESEAGFAKVQAYAEALCESGAGGRGRTKRAPTFRELAERWTSGELARAYPDHVRAKASVSDDIIRLARLYQTIGDVPLDAFTLTHAEKAMASIPEGRTPATRRHYAQLISRVLKLAVYPCKLIERTPLPVGFIPRTGTRPAFAFLYPSEDAKLLGCTSIALWQRLLYGFLAREGCRLSEALSLCWTHVDLELGVVRLEQTKTGDVRSWRLSDGVTAALRAIRGDAGPSERVFSGAVYGAAELFREALTTAGVDRAELFERSKARRPVRVHDLRATFITLALANGKTETWVQDRTGHTTSQMLARYRRQARHAAELNLGELAPLHLAIPELRGDGPEAGGNPGSDPGSGISRLPDSRAIPSGSTGTRTLDLRIKRARQPDMAHGSEPFLAAAGAPRDANEHGCPPRGPQPGQRAPAADPRTLLAAALLDATKAGRWELAAELARQLAGL